MASEPPGLRLGTGWSTAATPKVAGITTAFVGGREYCQAFRVGQSERSSSLLYHYSMGAQYLAKCRRDRTRRRQLAAPFCQRRVGKLVL